MENPAFSAFSACFVEALDSLRSCLLIYFLIDSALWLLFFSTSLTMASRILVDAAGQKTPGEVKPAEVYYGTTKETNSPIKLRIATGGAGQSGLVRALADAFIDDYISETKCPPFAVSWIKSDTTASFNHIADDTADLSITYHGAAEEIAIKQGVADRRVYAWRDHFMLVGM